MYVKVSFLTVGLDELRKHSLLVYRRKAVFIRFISIGAAGFSFLLL